MPVARQGHADESEPGTDNNAFGRRVDFEPGPRVRVFDEQPVQ